MTAPRDADESTEPTGSGCLDTDSARGVVNEASAAASLGVADGVPTQSQVHSEVHSEVHPDDVPAAIALAHAARAPLRTRTDLDSYRLFHGWTEGAPGLDIDRFADCIVIGYRGNRKALAEAAVPPMVSLYPTAHIAIRPWGSPGRWVRGKEGPERVLVTEGTRKIWIEPLAPRNPGLYLDARPARDWIEANARDRRVLNLFAFTGSLGVAAIIGGARFVYHADSQKRALARACDNHLANGHRLDGRDVLRGDVYQTLRRLAHEEKRFDGIILDPPPRVAPRKQRHAVDQDYDTLAPLASSLLAPSGWLLVFFHHDRRPATERAAEFVATASVPLRERWSASPDIDVPEPDPKNRLLMVAYERDA